MNTEFVLLLEAHHTHNPLTEISRILSPHLVHWQESRVIRMGDRVLGIIRLSGSWDMMAKIEAQLAVLSERSEITCTLTRTQERIPDNTLYPYQVQVVAPNIPGHVTMLIQFFMDHGIFIDQLSSDPYRTYTDTRMLMIQFQIEVPHHIALPQVRERLMDLCDAHNMDCMMDPLRG